MALNYEWHDFVGNLGVFLIVGSYFWMQLGRISGQSLVYSLVNAVGAAFILVSLWFNFNLSALVIELFWLAISLMGAVLGLKKALAVNTGDTPDSGSRPE